MAGWSSPETEDAEAADADTAADVSFVLPLPWCDRRLYFLAGLHTGGDDEVDTCSGSRWSSTTVVGICEIFATCGSRRRII